MSDSRLKSYALTAGGAAALATTGMAGADIQTSIGSMTISVYQSESLFSLSAVEFRAFNNRTGSSVSASFTASSAEFLMFDYGVSISGGFFGDSSTIYVSGTASTSNLNSAAGNLEFGSGKILGFRLPVADNYYGWINYDLSFADGNFTFTVNSWAYNDVANEGIIAGKNQAAGSAAVPGLGGLAALAIGAAGVRSRRQRTVA